MADKEPANKSDAIAETPQPKRKKTKAAIVVGVIAAIVVVAGVGFSIWHEQPSFCNAICHDPMDPYVEGYYAPDSTMEQTGKDVSTATSPPFQSKSQKVQPG